MFRMLSIPRTKLHELDTLFGILFIFFRRIIFSLAFSASQRNNFLHNFILDKTQQAPFTKNSLEPLGKESVNPRPFYCSKGQHKG
jgi:hypothetical protein